MTDTPTQPTPAPELILSGGHVIDPANGRDGALDVGIAGGRVVAVGPDLSAPASARVLDVAGRYVTPGIIDPHAHVCVTQPRSGLSLDPASTPSPPA